MQIIDEEEKDTRDRLQHKQQKIEIHWKIGRCNETNESKSRNAFTRYTFLAH